MAPPRCVLLQRLVIFVSGGTPTVGGGRGKEAAAEIDDESKAMEAILEAMKPDPFVVDPPALSNLTMVRQMQGGVPCGVISSTDKALVVLYAGLYRPFFTHCPSSGCYLVYDASSNSLSAVPQVPYSPSFHGLGCSAAIVSRGRPGTYVLAEICASNSGLESVGALYLWHSRDKGKQIQWDRQPVCLPPQVFDDHTYFIDMAFSYAGSSIICWVDLLKGMLVCDPFKAEEEPAELTFVPLPQGYEINLARRPRPRAEQFRTMGCINGVIKFVALVGYYENNYSSDDLWLRSWTLSPDLKVWKECNPLSVQDLWESESYRAGGLPKIPPSFPVLSMFEDEVVYLSMKDVQGNPAYNDYGEYLGVDIVDKAHYVLRIDMTENKVLHWRETALSTLTSHCPALLASEFTAYLDGSKDHERRENQSKH